ncbi:MAG: DUF1634 domain-containing protein [Deltaproteobacteria bacterium]|nr:DUF1634 domain-containing protein [Deltaproteobacteria bacterium]MBW2139851.1 DUF1634 domain-containing protein [Deltaproteobacteria bacterium]
MSGNLENALKVGPEQARYASILEKGMYLGLVLLLLTFLVYALGVIKPYIPIGEISRYWGLNVHDYLQQANIEDGWGWLRMLRYGDFLNFIGITVLAGVSIICYLAIVPLLFKNNDKIYVVLALLEVVALSLAASGILAVGH